MAKFKEAEKQVKPPISEMFNDVFDELTPGLEEQVRLDLLGLLLVVFAHAGVLSSMSASSSHVLVIPHSCSLTLLLVCHLCRKRSCWSIWPSIQTCVQSPSTAPIENGLRSFVVDT